MTYYTMLGFKVSYDLADNVSAVAPTTVTLDLAPGTPANLTYQFLNTPPVPPGSQEPLPAVDVTAPNFVEIYLEGGDPLGSNSTTHIGQVAHSGGTSYVLDIVNAPPAAGSTDWIFHIGGAPVPDFAAAPDPVSAWNAFGALITDIGPVTMGPYAPGAAIPLATMPSVTVLDGTSVIRDNPGDDLITTDAANNLVVNEGGGVDTIKVGAGDDHVILGPGPEGSEHLVEMGAGNDILDLSQAGPDPSDPTTGNSYVAISQHDLASPVTVSLNLAMNYGLIDKGANGNTVLIGPAAAMTGGVSLEATASNDTFNIDATGASGFLQLRGRGGNDTFNIVNPAGNSSNIRLDYAGASTGIVANLATGTIQDGEAGTDTLSGIVDELRGSDHDDSIVGSAADESFILRAGTDTVDGGGGSDALRYDRSGVTGGVTVNLATGIATGTWSGMAFTHHLSGIERVRGSKVGDDKIIGADGQSNELAGMGGNDTLLGANSDDQLTGGGGDDEIEGGAGNDSINPGAGNDTVDGGTGTDSVYMQGIASFDATITKTASGDIQVVSSQGTDLFRNVENFVFSDATVAVSSLFPSLGSVLTGTPGPDTLTGTALDDTIDGLGGADMITGDAGADSLIGGTGQDMISGGAGPDTILGGGQNDSLDGGDGNDLLRGDAGFDTLMGGLGADTLDGGDHADLVYGGDGADRILGGDGFDNLYGEAGNDTLLGGNSPDRLHGGAGKDVLRGGTNLGTTKDGLFGEAGNDTLFGEGGYDFLDGGDGDDLLDGGNQADNLYGRAGNDTLQGGQGFDRLFGGADGDLLQGGDGPDGLFGQQGHDTLDGGIGGDRVWGGTGNDSLNGGADDDVIYGGAGFDRIDGGTGNDQLTGNFNADTFVFVDGHGQDTVTDFAATNPFEKLDFSGLSTLNSTADVLAAASQTGADVLIDPGGGNTILLQNVALSDLDGTDFIF